MAVKAKQQYYADETTIKKEAREFGMIDELKDKLDSIEYGAQVNIIEEVQENGVPLEIVDKSVNVLVPEVIDNLYTIDPNNSLSAKQGKILYDMIKNLLARGRFLSTWNTATGLPVTNPEESPYEYKAGDYYIVGIVAAEGGTNFRPEPGEYVMNVASDEQETSEVHVSDIYVYDGENWILLINSTRELAVDDYVDHTYQSTNPVENQAIAREIDTKQNKFYTVSTTQPSNPVEGDEWYDATNDKVFYWDGTQWKEMGGGSTYTAGLHISIDPNDNNKISVVEWSATSSALGLVKLGSDTVQSTSPNNVTSTTGRTYRIQANGSGQLMVNVPWTDTTYIAGTGISISNNRVISCTVKPVTVSNTAPSNPGTGDLWYDTTKNTMFLYKNNVWTIIGPEIYPITKADYDALTPAEQGDGRFFLITDNDGTIYVDWENVQNRPMYIGATAPDNPCEGYIWYDTTNDVLKVYDGTQWNEIGGGTTYTAGNGISISNNEISIDTTVVATKTDLNSKQDVFHTTSSTTPSNPNEGDEWYDTADDILKVYNGTDWIVTGKTYTAGDGINIDTSNNEISVDLNDIVGDGLYVDGNSNLSLDKNNIIGDGLEIDSNNKLKVDPNDFVNTSNGLTIDNNGDIDISTSTIAMNLEGDGLSVNGSTNKLDVYPYEFVNTLHGLTIDNNGDIDIDTTSIVTNLDGDGLSVNGSTNKLDVYPYDFVNTTHGLTIDNNGDIDIDTSSLTTNLAGHGLSVNGSTNKLDVYPLDIAGNGLTANGNVLDVYPMAFVETSNGLTIDSNEKVDIDTATLATNLAGTGLYYDSVNNNISIDATEVATQRDLSSKQDKAESGSGAPATTPTYVGQVYIDTTNDNMYVATGTSSSSDWTAVDTNTTYTAGDGIDITNGEISVDASDLAGTGLSTDVNNNLIVDTAVIQEKLTASDGIDIDGSNNISVDVTDIIGTGLSEDANNNLIVDSTVVAMQSDLANYYTKTQTYTKTEVDNLISNFGNFEVVASLPSASTASTKTIYLLGPIGTGADKYEEWIVTEDSQQQKQWTKIGETSVDLSGYATTTALTNGLATKQDTLTSGDGIDIINDVISADIIAGNDISITSVHCMQESDRKGPAPSGFHIPSKAEWEGLVAIMDGLSFGGGEDLMINLHLPYAGSRSFKNASVSLNNFGTYWTSTSKNPGSNAYYFYFYDGRVTLEINFRTYGRTIRAFKNSYEAPDSSWTVIQGTLGNGGIFWDQINGLISITSDGSTGYTIMDKNLGATTVYSNGDTLSEANCGCFYQWGNNYGFAWSGNLTTSSTQADTSGYGPHGINGYYEGNTFIIRSSIPYDWSSSDNSDLWGDISNSTHKECGPGQGTLVINSTVDISGKQDKATSGSTAPSTTPTYVGQQYVDTTNDKLYVATGTSSSSDWIVAGKTYTAGDGIDIDANNEISVDVTDIIGTGLSEDANNNIIVDTTVVATQTDLSGKQDKATSGSTAPSTTPSYVGQQYIDTTADKMYVATGTTSSSDWTEVGAGNGDMLYSDFGWETLTGTTVTLALRGEIEPSANFTVNKPNDLKDGQFYVLRVITGATAYTMTLGTDVTNPYSEDLTLSANTIANFTFLAKNGELELQPSTEGISYTAGTGINIDANNVISADTQFVVVDTLPSVSTANENKIYILGPIGTGADKYEEWIVSNPTIEDKVTLSSSSASATISDTITITASDISITRASGAILAYYIDVYQNGSVLFGYSDGGVPSGLSDADGNPVDSITIPAGTISASDFSTITSISIKVGEHTEKTWTKIGETSVDLSQYALNSDVNTKSFTLSSLSDTTTIRNAIDWKNAGKNPIIIYDGHEYVTGSYSSGTSWILYSTNVDISPNSSSQNKMTVSYDLGSPVSIAITSENVSSGSGDMLYADFNWVSKTGATVTLDLNSTITPSANFTVNAPSTIKDGQVYILRVINGATAYTMTLGTGITNPYSTSTTLTANGVDQFVFQAIGGNLELLPDTDIVLDTQVDSSSTNGITNGAITTYVNGTKQDKTITGSTAPSSTPQALGQFYLNTTSGDLYIATGTTSSADWKAVGGGNVIAMTQAEYNALTTEEKNDGKLRIITDAPTEDISVDWANIANKPIELSTQSGNTLTSLKIWVGSQTDYEALSTKDDSTLYFTTNVVS